MNLTWNPDGGILNNTRHIFIAYALVSMNQMWNPDGGKLNNTRHVFIFYALKISFVIKGL